jgi:hypothetical protein
MKKILIVEDNSDYREIMNLSITKDEICAL